MTTEKSLWDIVKEWFGDASYAAATDCGKGAFTKAELRQRLIALVQSSPPPKESLSMGAMCYKPTPFSGTIDVICTHCKQKNIVKKDYNTARLEDMSRLVQLLEKTERSIDVGYDNRFCCTSCNPSLKGQQGPIEAEKIDHRLYRENKDALDGCYLTIKYKDETEARRVKIGLRGLRLLVAFIHGKNKVANENDREHPLKDDAAVIAMILGIKDYQKLHDE